VILKRPIEGHIVKVLTHTLLDRGMELIEFESRCLQQREIHELVATDHDALVAGSRVDRVAFLGFVEVAQGGVADRDDVVVIDGVEVGRVVGFDDCHFPNHYNIVIRAPVLANGADIGLRPGARVQLVPGGSS
jgi:hypothetical protein